MDIRKRSGAKGTSYQVRWVSGGKTKYESFPLRKDAAAFIKAGCPEPKKAEEKKKIETVAEVGAKEQTIGDAVDIWLHVCEHIGRNGEMPVERATMRSYTRDANHIRTLPNPDGGVFKDLPLKGLNGPTMGRIRDALLLRHSRNMARTVLVSLKGALTEAEARGQIDSVPGRSVTIRRNRRDKDRFKIPEPSEIRHLLAVGDSLHDDPPMGTPATWRRKALLIETMIFSGLRPSELRGLPRKNLVVASNKIIVTQRADEFGVIGPPKTPAGHREVDISPELMGKLVDFRDTRPKDPDALIFGTRTTGLPEDLSSIHSRCWYPWQKRAGFVTASGKVRFKLYWLRHFRASIEIAMGANPKEIQILMGHENVQFTMQIYGHVFREHRHRGVSRAAELHAALATNSPQEISDGTGTTAENLGL